VSQIFLSREDVARAKLNFTAQEGGRPSLGVTERGENQRGKKDIQLAGDLSDI